MRKRVGDRWGRARLYFLLDFNRWVFAALLAAAVFVSFLVVGEYSPFRHFMRRMGPSRYLFQGLTGALVTGVTLVVTINQLVLSQELGFVGTERKRMSDSMNFRDDAEDVFGATSPPEPEAFLQALVENTADRAQAVQDAVAGTDNDDLREHVENLVDDITENADTVSGNLEDRSFGEYAVVKAALDYNYSWKIYQTERIGDVYADDLDGEQREAIVDLRRALSFFGPAREYIKGLYIQWELVDLSRRILYTAIPAITVTGTLTLYLAPELFSGTTLGVANIVWVVSAGATAGFVPFLVLAVYVLRLATIAKRTLAIGPFILRSSERGSEIEPE